MTKVFYSNCECETSHVRHVSDNTLISRFIREIQLYDVNRYMSRDNVIFSVYKIIEHV